MNAAAAGLLFALKTVLATFKTRSRVKAARRKAAAAHLDAYVAKQKSSAKEGRSADAASKEPAKYSAGSLESARASLPHPSAQHASGDALTGMPSEAAGRDLHPAAAISTVEATTQNVPRPVPACVEGSRAAAAAIRTTDATGSRAPPASLTLPAAAMKAATQAIPKTRKQPTRRPDCWRKPFKHGKGDEDADSPFLLSAVLKLDKDNRRELLSFLTAVTIDSVVLPFRPAHAAALRRLAACLKSSDAAAVLAQLLALSTANDKDGISDGNALMVELLKDLRFVQLGLRSCLALFKDLPRLPGLLASCLSCVAASIDRFMAECQAGPEATMGYQSKWVGAGLSQVELCRYFCEAFPRAALTHEKTGTCAPSLPQCLPEPFLWEEVLSTGMCSKHYAKAHKFSPGAMTFCCGCKHPLIIAFTVLDRKEAPQVLLNMLLTLFARLPRFLIYDFACGAIRVALGRLGWLLMDCTVLSDRFHIFNHLCSDAFDPRSYAMMDGVDTGAPEQRNAPIRRIQTTLQGMGVVPPGVSDGHAEPRGPGEVESRR